MANNDIEHLQISEISEKSSVQDDISRLQLDIGNSSPPIKTTLGEICELVECIHDLSKGKLPELFPPEDLRALSEIVFCHLKSAASYNHINSLRTLAKALVELYGSLPSGNKELAKDLIKLFLQFITEGCDKYSGLVSLSLLCVLLNKDFHEDPLYLVCRKTLERLLEDTSPSPLKLFKKRPDTLREILPIVIDLANKLCYDMDSSMETITWTGSLFVDAPHFKTFSRLLYDTIQERTLRRGEFIHIITYRRLEHIITYHNLINMLLTKMGKCLSNVENLLSVERIMDQNEIRSRGWFQYLGILKELSLISKPIEGGKERFWGLLKSKKHSVCALIILNAQQSDLEWLFNHRDGTDTEFKIYLTTMMIHNKINNVQRPEIKDWKKFELLGRGSHGSVYEGFAAQGFFFAAKIIEFPSEDSLMKAQKEINFLSQFNHENIIQYYGTESGDSILYIFLELASKGSLDKLYKKYPLQDSQVAAYTRQILHGLKYLHDQNVIHRDIKCANILVDVNGTVKLADFGLAKVIESTIKSSHGTPWWMAPEVVNSSTGYKLKADIWSVGCTVLEMLTRKRPYHELEYQQAMYKIGNGQLPYIPDSLTPHSRDFILKCLQVDPNLRPTASELLSHPFLEE